MPNTPDAARLTAIAERLKRSVENGDVSMVDEANWRFLLAHVETLTQQVADWAAANEVIRQDFEDAKEENARLTAEVGVRAQDHIEAHYRAKAAEQQRDAAHAALRAAGFDINKSAPLQHFGPCRHWTGGACNCPLAKIDAALAASAPQKESATWRCIFCGEPSETGGGYEAGEVGPFCESCYLHLEEHFAAPAQETERGR